MPHHMPSSQRQGCCGTRGGYECCPVAGPLPRVRADRCRRMIEPSHYRPNPPPCSVRAKPALSPPAGALYRRVPPALLLRPNNSVLSLNSLMGSTELEGLAPSSRPPSLAGLSSRCGSGASELMQLNSRAGNVDTPPGGPAAFETSDKLGRCLAPQVVQGGSELGLLGPSHPNPDLTLP